MTSDSKAVCGGGEAYRIHHEFKSAPSVFYPAKRGTKMFEFRKDDRGGYHVGQNVRLRCYEEGVGYTDEAPLERTITNILYPGQFGLQDGYCILGLAPISAALASTAGAGAGDWQPIETAPKDGTRIDLWAHWPDLDISERVANARWSKDGEWEFSRRLALQYTYRPEILHWLPLPAGPGQSPAVPASPRAGAGEGEGIKTAALNLADTIRSMVGRAIDEDGRMCDAQDPLDDLCDAIVDQVLQTFAALAPNAKAGEDLAEVAEWLKHACPIPAYWRRVQAVAALSQGGGAGRSERAVEIRERAGAVFIIIRTTGEYSDRSEDLIAATFDGEAAKRWTEETQRVCQTLAAETNRALIEAGFETEQATRAAAKARCPDPTFEPWGGYAEDVQYGVREIKIGLPAPAQSPSTSDAEG